MPIHLLRNNEHLILKMLSNLRTFEVDILICTWIYIKHKYGPKLIRICTLQVSLSEPSTMECNNVVV